LVRLVDLFTQLVRVEIELWNGLDTHLLTTVGISLPQFQALAAIRAAEAPARVQDISEEMSITVGATSKVIDRLERDGLAIRSANPNDRRSSIVSLSDRGVNALVAANGAAETHLRTVLGGVLADNEATLLLGQLTSLRSLARSTVMK